MSSAVRPLRSSKDHERVRRAGRRARRDGLTVFVAPAPEPAAPARLGLAVRARRAVRRNRVKRRLRAAFGRCAPPAGIDVVVSASGELAEVDFQELVDHLCAALRAALGEGRS